ncbi:MAG: hypothetical protein KIA12_03245 [Varibaculum cambriense]|uniref:DUF5979 domain-containing protein n=3 Tax=Varibaculum cambriense TaxID=184870 RepID=UPI00241D2BB3|nr:DUF5979 domain-containing protein [Varibaculum cambriense]MBS5972488.1 hypothetical protein [Varibaculum cambriense]
MKSVKIVRCNVAGHNKSQKLVAVLTLLGLVIAMIPVAVLTLPQAQAEPSDPNHPIIGGADDPWPSDPPRDLESEDIKNAGSVALVFEFGSWYGYQTMGGGITGTGNKPCPKDYPQIPASRKRLQDGKLSANCRNWDQNEAVANVIEPLKGSPLSVGIYHYARKQDQGRYGNNTPDLKATSLADAAGYQKVMNKIWSLDATNGNGGNMQTGYAGNGEWGLGKLYLDMLRYRQQQLKEHAGEADFVPRPLYSKIIIMSASDPHWHLDKSVYDRKNDVWKINHYIDGESDEEQLNQDLINKDLDTPAKNFVEDPDNKDSQDSHSYKWKQLPLTANPGRVGMLDVASRIRNLGADIRTMGMGDWVDKFPNPDGGGESTRHMFLRALTGVEDYQQPTSNYQYIPFPSDSSGGSPGGHFGYPNGDYFSNPARDGIANGSFERSMRQWMWEDTHLSLTSDLLDGNFRYVKPNARQTINFSPLDTATTPQNYSTGNDGRVVINLTKAQMTKGVDVRQPERTDKYVLTQFQGHNARCRGLSRTDGQYQDFFPENLDKDTDGRSGFRITAEQYNEFFSIKCSSYSRPLQKLQLIKKAGLENEQIRYEIGGQPTAYNGGVSYDFQWKCTDPKAQDPQAVVAQGTAKRQVKGLNVAATLDPIDISDVAMPVGTQCTINETLNLPEGYTLAKANSLFTSNTEVKGTNFKLDEAQTQKTKDGGQSVSNKIVGNVQLFNPDNTTTEISQLVSNTTYSSLRAHIKVDVKFSNSGNDAAIAAKIANGTLPKKIPVYYNCRFMPDPTKPPELPETNVGSYPGFVGVDWVGVNTDGTASITLGKDQNGNDIWPAGTHCLFATTPPNANIHGPNPAIGQPVKIPGVVTKDSYSSTICAEDATSKPSTAKNCKNNYFWVHSGGEQVIHLTEDLQRLKGKLRVTKQLTGEAAGQGVNKEFPMHLSCQDEGISLPVNGNETYNFSVKRSEPQIVESVPAGASCTLIEDAQGSALQNAEVAIPAPIAINPITDTTVIKDVTVTNDLTYKRASLEINHTLAWANPKPEAATQQVLMTKDNLITASCRVPGDTAQPDKTVTITGNGSQTLTDLPAGSVCNIQSVPQNISDISVNYQAPPQQVTIPASGTATVDLTTTYSLPAAGSWYLRPIIHSRPEYQALRSLIPDKVNATLSCEGVADPQTVAIDLKDGSPTEIATAGIPSQANCSLSGRLIPQVEESKFEIRYNISGDDYEQADHGAQLTANTQAPESGKSSTQTLHLWFKTKNTSVNLASSSSMWTSKAANATATTDRIPVPDQWRKVALGIADNDADSKTVPLSVSCKLGSGANESTVTYPLQLSNGGSANPLSVPNGWNCSVSASDAALKIPGTTLQKPEWEGANGTATTDGYQYDWTSGDGQSITLKRDYRMQLASFNLKKKVGGEGVTIISGDKQFQMDWTCTLNEKPINIPTPRTIDVNTDAQATFGNDLAARLQNLKPSGRATMGRFLQGEWHVVDALPAGAVCTLTENSDIAQVENTVWDHYWEITDGYRSREPATACEASSDKCRPADEGTTVKAQVLLPRDKEAKANPYFNNEKDNPKDPQGKPRNPVVPDTLPENFAGTMVPWNNYTFQKTQVKVSLNNSGNGAELAHGKTFSARLYCAPPPLIGAEGAEIPGSAAAIINVELTFKESATNPGTWEDAVANQLIPVNYRCVLAEAKFPQLDAKVTTTIAKDATQPTVTANKDGLTDLFAYNQGQNSQVKDDPNLNLQSGDHQILGFIVHPQLVNDAQESQKQSLFTIENKFDRPAANVKVAQVVRKDSTDTDMSFGQVLVDKGQVGYRVHYRCTDKYLKEASGDPKVYQGSVDLAADSTVSLLSGQEGANFVPATSKCVFWHENQDGKDPVATYAPQLSLNPSATVTTEGTPNQEEKSANQSKPDSLKVSPLNLDKEGKKVTTITFEDFYFAPYAKYEVGTAVEGARRDEILPADTKYQYSYSCTYPEGLPVPAAYADGKYPKVEGTTDQAERGNFVSLPKVPVGSTCVVTGNKPDTSATPYLKVAGNWVPWDVDKLGFFLEDSTNFNQQGLVKNALSGSPFTVTLNQDTQRGVVLYSVYTNGSKVRIYKADSPKGNVIPDASFKLVKADPNGQPGEEIPLKAVAGQNGVYESATELAPGSYLVANLNAGKNAGERFPFDWKFDITLDPVTQADAQDTQVGLSGETQSSGLVAVYKPTTQINAWQIELADVTFGKLPLTGGYLPWLWAFGISLVLASAAVMWHRRRE